MGGGRLGGPAGAQPAGGGASRDGLMLRRPPEDTPLEALFVDVARRCGMDEVADPDALAAAAAAAAEGTGGEDDRQPGLRQVAGMLRSLRGEFITTAAALWVAYQSPEDLQRRYEDCPRGFVSTIYLTLLERDEQRRVSRVSSFSR